MFRSIFTKYITTFMLIIIASFAMLASIISTMIVNTYSGTSDNQLSGAADSIRYLIEKRMLDSESDTLRDYIATNSPEIGAYFAAFTKYTDDMAIFLSDSEGNILASMGFTDSKFGSKKLSASVMTDVKNGGYRSYGNLGGVLAVKRAVLGVPIKNTDGEVIGAAFACTTDKSLNTLMVTTVKAIIMTCLWVLLAALIAVYFISDKIISPLKDMGKAAKSFAAGKFDVRVPVTGHDEISELAVAFNNMAGSLADLENMRSTFLSNVSHDLRTPMTTISGFIDGLLDGTIPEEKQKYYLRMIGDEVRRLSRLVAALLDVSRIQAGDRKFTMQAFDICEMARVILLSFEQKIDKKRLEVAFETDEENMYAWADHDAIYQILYNICDNGVKFSREGGKYRIRIIERDRKIFVSVYNEGEGIKSEDLPHVFERFYKGDKSRGLDKTGTGLGLYIAKSIIDAHNEEIWVKSKYGEYCEFIFTLKIASDSQVKKAFSKPLPEPPKALEQGGEKPRDKGREKGRDREKARDKARDKGKETKG